MRARVSACRVSETPSAGVLGGVSGRKSSLTSDVPAPTVLVSDVSVCPVAVAWAIASSGVGLYVSGTVSNRRNVCSLACRRGLCASASRPLSDTRRACAPKLRVSARGRSDAWMTRLNGRVAPAGSVPRSPSAAVVNVRPIRVDPRFHACR